MNRIRVESNGAVAHIALARPEKRNALDHETTALASMADATPEEHYTDAEAEALQMGLISRVLEADDFDERVATIAREIAESSASAQSLTKTLFYQLDGLGFRDGVLAGARANAAARMTPDFRAGVTQ
jgi:enoyl-CoA hydratase/carnithine racemase